MRTKKISNFYPSRFRVLFAATVIFIFLLVGREIYSTDFWWRFTTSGEVYSQLAFDKKSFYFGNNAQVLYAVNTRTGRERWRFEDFQSPVMHGPLLTGKLVLFSTESGILYAVNSKTGKEVWSFSNPKGVRFVTSPQIYKGTVLIGDANGILYSLYVKNGKTKWIFETGEIRKLSNILIDSHLNWFGIFKIQKNFVYLSSRDGKVYKLDARTGKNIWNFDSGYAVTTEVNEYGSRVYFGNSNGVVFALNSKVGNLLFKDSLRQEAITCVTVLPKKAFETNPVIVSVYTGGKLIARQSGENIWEFDAQSKEVRCPLYWKGKLFLVDGLGNTTALNSKNGTEVWRFTSEDGVQHIPIVKYKFFKFDWHALKFKLDIPYIFFGDRSGNLFALNARDGKVIWNFKAFSKINGSPKVVGRHIFFQSSDGGIYKIRAIDGRLDKPILYNLTFRPKFSATTNKKITPYFYEITVNFKDDFLTNPFREAQLTGEYWQEGGVKIKVDGFYFDKDTWKIRFSPGSAGKWHFKAIFTYPGKSFDHVGEFEVLESEVRSFLKVASENKRRLTLDGKTIFNGLGIQASTLDTNYNGNPFDDWAVGEGERYLFASDEIIDLDRYLGKYGSEGGFNLFRWGPGNSSFRLWQNYSVNAKYHSEWARWADTLLESLSNHDFRVWLTLFSFDIPYSQNMRPVEYALINNYVDYIIARYGVYVDVWEVGNEVYAPDYVIDHIARRIKEKDYLDRPVSTSWEKPQLTSIDIISPHWYETEKINDSDISVVRKISNFENSAKPVVFGEQGNQKVNWDETSGVRMRIRNWTAFFNEVMLIFWNQSSTRDFYNSTLNNANIFIGPEERKYSKVLQDFTTGIGLQTKKMVFNLNTSEVRSYGLVSDKEILGYFFHYKDPNKNTSVNFQINVPKTGKLIWLNPSSGEILQEKEVSQGLQFVRSPNFRVDLAMKIEFL